MTLLPAPSVERLPDSRSPRNRLLAKNADALSDLELLSVLLHSTNEGRLADLAQAMLGVGGTLRDLILTDPHELAAAKGLGPRRAAQLLAAIELCRRAQNQKAIRPRLCTPDEIHDYLKGRMTLLRKEVFHLLCFNPRNQLLLEVRIAEGTANACPVDPRDIFRAALTCRASAIVVAHNHPTGDPEPSTVDIALTRQLWAAAALLGIKMLDHIVVGDEGFTSMRRRGEIPSEHEKVPAWKTHCRSTRRRRRGGATATTQTR